MAYVVGVWRVLYDLFCILAKFAESVFDLVLSSFPKLVANHAPKTH